MKHGANIDSKNDRTAVASSSNSFEGISSDLQYIVRRLDSLGDVAVASSTTKAQLCDDVHDGF